MLANPCDGHWKHHRWQSLYRDAENELCQCYLTQSQKWCTRWRMGTHKRINTPPNVAKQAGSIHMSYLMFLVKYHAPKEVHHSEKLHDHAFELQNLCVSKGDSRLEKKYQNQPILNQWLRKYLEIYCSIYCRNLLIKRRLEIVTQLEKLQKIREIHRRGVFKIQSNIRYRAFCEK